MSIRMQLGGLMTVFMALLLAAITAVCLQFASAQSTHLASERNHFLLNSLRKTAEDFLATGMTPEQIRLSWGKPTSVDEKTNHWIYGSKKLHFSKNVLHSIDIIN